MLNVELTVLKKNKKLDTFHTLRILGYLKTVNKLNESFDYQSVTLKIGLKNFITRNLLQIDCQKANLW